MIRAFVICLSLISIRASPFFASRDDLKLDLGFEFRSAKADVNWFNWTSWTNGPACPQRIDSIIDISAPILEAATSKIQYWEDRAIGQYKDLGLLLSISTGIVYNGKQIYTNNIGTVDSSKNQPPTSDTVYNIGSVTKIFTSLALAQAVDAGLTSYDASVDDYFNDANPPVFRVLDHRGKEVKITMDMLAAHISGLPRECPVQMYAQDYNISQIFENINLLGLMYPPNARTHYSNLGITLIGRALERIVNNSYEQEISQKILEPLGLNGTGFDYPPDVMAKMAIGYTLVGKQQVPTPIVPMGWPAPAGGLHSSVNDLSNFMMSIMSPENSGKNLGISPENLRGYTALPGFQMADGISSIGKSTWETFYSHGYEVKVKGGLVPGYATSIAFVPELKLGSVVLINLNSGSFPATMTTIHMNYMIPTIVNYLSQNQPVPAFPANVQDLLGVYKVQGAVLANVTMSAQQGYLDIALIDVPLAIGRWRSDISSALGIAFEYWSANEEPCFMKMAEGEGILYFQPDQGILVAADFAITGFKSQ